MVPMSALGQKQTFAAHQRMSALPPKADMCSALGDVRFVPIADISSNEISRAELCQDACDIAHAPMLDDTFVLHSENIARGEAQ